MREIVETVPFSKRFKRMIKILKASAGSGKTFSLAKEYISLLLSSDDPYAYRHILAVTFTNKATDEMKQRILKELDNLASEPEKSKYLEDLRKTTGKDARALSLLSRRFLCNILNDYGAFSISTIDRFFQRTLKAFSREIGQFASYQVELDKASLVRESVDRILDSLTEDNKSLLSWLTDSVKEQLVSGGKFSLDSDLNDIAVALMNDEYRESVKTYGIDESKVYSKEGLAALKKGCSEIMSAYVKEVKTLAGNILASLESAGVGVEKFSGGSRSFMRKLYNYTDIRPADKLDAPGDSFVTKACDSSKWFSKQNASLLPLVEPLIAKPLYDFCAMFRERYNEYCTAKLIRGQIYSLGLVREIRESFNRLVREKNVMSLDDSNTVLRDIIDGSDAPFIYEKIGVRYDHFLLDEFQDTAGIQWDNFRPLLSDSDASGNLNLIVGDVKQSIYRWRNSDWNLLNTVLKQQFPDAKESPLLSNWRSTSSIVSFNNAFYLYASRMLDRSSGTGQNTIEQIYSDVKQNVELTSLSPGNVDVLFCSGTDSVNASEAQVKSVLEEISRLKASGASYSDIGILVRTNKAGSDIANSLLFAGIPVVSDDSLSVKSSPSVRRLVALLSFADNPDDKLNAFLASSLEIKPPAEWHSLIDLCEYFIREMKSGTRSDFEGEVPYIHAFMDTVQDWSQINGNSLSEFLSYWDTVDPKICSPKNSDAVQVMTLHKSKGLSFPYVIFPFAENVVFYKSTKRWCYPESAGTALEGMSKGIYRIDLDSSAENTLFSEDYRKEAFMQMVDAINMFYVATTRAEKGMLIIAKTPSNDCLGCESEGTDYKFRDMSQVLHWYLALEGSKSGFSIVPAHSPESVDNFSADDIRFSNGEIYNFEHTDATSDDSESRGYPSYPLNADECPARLEFSSEDTDFFSPDGNAGIEASVRLKGIVLHDILSKVIVHEDLETAISESYNAGAMDDKDRIVIFSMLSERIASAKARGWFPDDRSCVFNETSVVDVDGTVHRPDRVVVKDGKVTIIDYKFGRHRNKYVEQVQRYAELYRAAGYNDVSCRLWYVAEDEVVEV